MPGGGITAPEAQAVGRGELAFLQGQGGPFGIFHQGAHGKSRRLTAPGQVDSPFHRNIPGEIKARVLPILGQQFGFGQAGAGVFRRVASNVQGSRHRLLHRQGGKVAGGSVALALAQVDRDAQALVPVVFDGFHLPLAHRHGLAEAFRHIRFTG